MQLWHKLCNNYNRLRISKIHLLHKLCNKLRTLEGLNKPIGVSTYTDNLMRMVEEHLDALQVVTEAPEGEAPKD